MIPEMPANMVKRTKRCTIAALPVPCVMTLLYIDAPTFITVSVAYFGGCITVAALFYAMLLPNSEATSNSTSNENVTNE